MMRVLIIEDEHLAAERVKDLLGKYDGTISVLAILDSIVSTVQWFKKNPSPDLVFMDIQLADGLSFDIFGKVKIDCPVIFTTAYKEYAIKAFKVNSVDYLLKPIDYEDMKTAIVKFQQQHYFKKDATLITADILESVKNMLSTQYKNRFVVKVGEHIKSIELENIHYFFSLEKGTYLCTVGNKNYDLDYSLDSITEMLNPQMFFRANRKYIISRQAILDIIVYSNSRLKIRLRNSDDEKIIISRDKVSVFKSWLDN